MEEKKTNKTLIYVICIILVAALLIGGWYLFGQKSKSAIPKENEPKQVVIPVNETLSDKEYAVLYSRKSVSEEVFDFTNKNISTGGYGNVKFVDNKLHWIQDYGEGENDVVIKTKQNNIVSVLTTYSCGDANGIYYLTSDNKLYYFDISHGELNNKGNETLLADDATGITRFSYSLVDEESTCGGFVVLYKGTDGKVYYANTNSENKSEKEVKNMEYVNDIGAFYGENYSLHITDEQKKVSDYDYLKDGSGKEIIAKEVYIPSDSDTTVFHEKSTVVIIDDKGIEYTINETVTSDDNSDIIFKTTGKILSKAQKNEMGTYTFTYSDGTKNTYDMERIY